MVATRLESGAVCLLHVAAVGASVRKTLAAFRDSRGGEGQTEGQEAHTTAGCFPLLARPDSVLGLRSTLFCCQLGLLWRRGIVAAARAHCWTFAMRPFPMNAIVQLARLMGIAAKCHSDK